LGRVGGSPGRLGVTGGKAMGRLLGWSGEGKQVIRDKKKDWNVHA
jgi:hypothetical protein